MDIEGFFKDADRSKMIKGAKKHHMLPWGAGKWYRGTVVEPVWGMVVIVYNTNSQNGQRCMVVNVRI